MKKHRFEIKQDFTLDMNTLINNFAKTYLQYKGSPSLVEALERYGLIRYLTPLNHKGIHVLSQLIQLPSSELEELFRSADIGAVRELIDEYSPKLVNNSSTNTSTPLIRQLRYISALTNNLNALSRKLIQEAEQPKEVNPRENKEKENKKLTSPQSPQSPEEVESPIQEKKEKEVNNDSEDDTSLSSSQELPQLQNVETKQDIKNQSSELPILKSFDPDLASALDLLQLEMKDIFKRYEEKQRSAVEQMIIEREKQEKIKAAETMQSDLEDKLCVICMESAKVMCFGPCGHVATCEQCSVDLHQCPICQGKINQRIRAYF